MARLHEVSEPESDGEFPDLATLLVNVRIGGDATKRENEPSAKARKASGASKTPKSFKSGQKTFESNRQIYSEKQKLSHRGSSLLTCSNFLPPTAQLLPSKLTETKKSPRKTHHPPQVKGQQLRGSRKSSYRSYGESENSDDSDTSLSGFIVSDSDSEDERTPEKSTLGLHETFNGKPTSDTESKGISRSDDWPKLAPPKTPRRLITRKERDLLQSIKTVKKIKDPQVVIDLISPVKQTLVRRPSEENTQGNEKDAGTSRSRSQSVERDDVLQQDSSMTRDSSATDSSLLERSMPPAH